MNKHLQLFRRHKVFNKYTDEQLLKVISYIVRYTTEPNNEKIAIEEWIEGNKKSPYLNDLIDQLHY